MLQYFVVQKDINWWDTNLQFLYFFKVKVLTLQKTQLVIKRVESQEKAENKTREAGTREVENERIASRHFGDFDLFVVTTFSDWNHFLYHFEFLRKADFSTYILNQSYQYLIQFFKQNGQSLLLITSLRKNFSSAIIVLSVHF